MVMRFACSSKKKKARKKPNPASGPRLWLLTLMNQDPAMEGRSAQMYDTHPRAAAAAAAAGKKRRIPSETYDDDCSSSTGATPSSSLDF